MSIVYKDIHDFSLEQLEDLFLKEKIKKSYPFLYGIFGSLGFVCLLSFCTLDYRVAEHPYSYPFAIVAGFISLCMCVMVLCLDVNVFLQETKKLRRLFSEIFITALTFIVFIFAWSELWEASSRFIKYMGW